MNAHEQAEQDRESLMRAILQAGQDAGIIRQDLGSVSLSQCHFILGELSRPVSAPASKDRSTAGPDLSTINAVIAKHFGDDGANACRAQSAILELMGQAGGQEIMQ